jgi:major membrane immunogen (membrane-anchored lipoprotein)
MGGYIMKKLLSLVMVLTLVVFTFAAGHIDLADGEYRAERLEPSHGWVDFVELTVENGKFTDVVLDAYNPEDGSLKSEDEAYAERMGMDPAEFFATLANDLEDKQHIDEVDTVTGATSSSNIFRALVNAIMDRGVAGSTIIVDLSRYMLEDGEYRAERAEASHGWTDFVEITVKNGNITKAVADAYDAKGNLKTNDKDYAERMGMNPAKFYATLAENVKNSERASEIDTVTGATSSSSDIRLLTWSIYNRGVPGETIKVDLSSFVAGDLEDGEYRAEFAEASHGWTTFLEITVENGLIVKAYADAYNEDGNLKTDDPYYAENMGYDPVRFFGVLAQEIISGQSVEEIDTFTGATHTSDEVRTLLRAILENGEAGKTIKVK